MQDPQNTTVTQSKRWYQRSGWIIFFLIVFFPVGLYLMWKYAPWSGAAKWVITGVLAVAVIVNLSSGGTETPEQVASGEQAQQEQVASESAPQQQEAPEPEPEPEPEQEPQQPVVAQIGQTVAAGDLQWQVTNARRATELQSQFGDFGEPRQGNFVIVDFLVINNGNEAIHMTSESLALFDAQERKFQTDTDTFEYIDPDKDILLEQINPGVTQEGEVIFSVAPDAQQFILEVGDAALFSDEAARVALGF